MPLRRLLFELSKGSRAVTPTAGSCPWSGDGRARTGDPLLAKQVLSQLSYAPTAGGAAVIRCGRRGPFWIRTRDLTVISRALSPTELKARGARHRRTQLREQGRRTTGRQGVDATSRAASSP
jgi:hypothetical protein